MKWQNRDMRITNKRIQINALCTEANGPLRVTCLDILFYAGKYQVFSKFLQWHNKFFCAPVLKTATI